MSDLDALFSALAASARVLWLVPLLPLLAAAADHRAPAPAAWHGDAGEPITAGWPARRRSVRCSCCWSSIWRRSAVPCPSGGLWRMAAIGAVPVRLSFMLDAYSLPMATLVALIAWIALRFSATYLHRERAFQRFFLGMCLFLAGMLLIVLAATRC
jgi:NADH:ubiquinone oxidoreductase subunit 5 (subunit L)/multisubunit Na+/H+ antiporter MnhA subunit